jgi:hypothetical protein
MSDLTTWRARAADPDVVAAAEVWTDQAAPTVVLRSPPAEVLDYLVDEGCWRGTLRAVLANPAVSNTVRADLAKRAKGKARAIISEYALGDLDDLSAMVAVAAAITPAELEKAVNSLRFGWDRDRDPDGVQSRLAKILRAFTTSSQTRCRALAAQAFPLVLGPRHRYADGEVSASRLITDLDVAVLVALARNPNLRHLPETPEGLEVRRALLSSAEPRVRTAARRAGVHVTDSHIEAAFAAAYGNPVTVDPDTMLAPADPLDDAAPAVRVTAVANGIHRQDGARWARVLADPSAQVRKAAATHGWGTPRFVWTALASDRDPVVRKAVAASRWAPTELQRLLLSDADPSVGAAAEARDPLSRQVRVHPSLPADGGIMLPVSYTRDPRIRLLDVTAATLTLGQQRQLAEAARAGRTARAEARDRVIGGLGTHLAHADADWIADRWGRWTQVFAVPAPISTLGWARDRAAAPFRGLDTADDRVTGALALFDAVLGLAAAPDSDQGDADRALLTQPWERVCLPTTHTADTVYGARTASARQCLTSAARLPRSTLDAVLTTRIGIDQQQWRAARNDAIDVAAGPDGHVYAAHFLFWDAVAAAELAAREKPTDPLLADALWGAAAAAAYGDTLSATTIAILTRPWTAAGLTPSV